MFELSGICVGLFTVSSSFWMPESPRFLISHKKYDESLNVYKKIARINGVKFEENVRLIEGGKSE